MSKFQPDHRGNHPQVKINPGMTPAHSSDRTHIGEHHAVKLTLGKPPKPKHGSGNTPVHGGMHHVTNGKPVTGGGSNRSYLDSLSGTVVPDARNTAAAGWDTGGNVRSGNPMVHAPAGKNLKPVKIHPSMSKGADHDKMLSDLGAAVLRSAVANK